MTPEEKLAAVGRALDDLRHIKNDPTAPEYGAYCMLKEYAVELRAQTSQERSRVLLALEDQVSRAKRFNAQHGHYDIGHCQTITEALCGRWLPTVRAALRQFQPEPGSAEALAAFAEKC